MIQSSVDAVLEHGNDWSTDYSLSRSAVVSAWCLAQIDWGDFVRLDWGDFVRLLPDDAPDDLAAPKLVSESHLHYADSNDAWLIESQQRDGPDADTARALEAYDNQAPTHVPFWRR